VCNQAAVDDECGVGFTAAPALHLVAERRRERCVQKYIYFLVILFPKVRFSHSVMFVRPDENNKFVRYIPVFYLLYLRQRFSTPL
jgi:hypothetical protein